MVSSFLTFQCLTTREQLIKHMEISLRFAPHYNSTLLQEIPINVCTSNAAVWSKGNTDKLSKTTGVIVTLRLSISESLQNRVGLQDLAFKEAEATFRIQAASSRSLRNCEAATKRVASGETGGRHRNKGRYTAESRGAGMRWSSWQMSVGGDSRKILNDLLRAFRLSCARFSTKMELGSRER